jgi:hypothetical protein
MEIILSEKAIQARQHNASVGKVYPTDERFAEVKRNAEIRQTVMSMPENPRYGEMSMDEAHRVLKRISAGRETNIWKDMYRSDILLNDRSESLGIADEIITGPGVGCEPGEACVPFETHNGRMACRECNQVRD